MSELIEEIDEDFRKNYIKKYTQEICEILKIDINTINTNQKIDIMNIIITIQNEAYGYGWSYF